MIVEEPLYDDAACCGRLRWAFLSIWSLVDLASILPWYIDFLLVEDIPAAQFIRLLRLLRLPALRTPAQQFVEIFRESRTLFALTAYVSFTTWIVASALYWLAEKDNPNMTIRYGETEDGNATEFKRFGSIASASYYTLVNMCGEYPLIKEHSDWGK